MKLSVLLATICACEVIFWTQASASEGANQAQIMDHLSNTKEIHLTDLCSKAPADALPAACSELEQADPPRSRADAQQSTPVIPVKTLHRSTEGRPDRSSQKDLLLDGESDQTAPRPKSESQPEQNSLLGDASSLVTFLVMLLACGGCVLRCLMNHGWKETVYQSCSCAVWLGVLALPLVLAFGTWQSIFPSEWCEVPTDKKEWPSALGLSLGLLGVAVGQLFVILYHWLRREGLMGSKVRVQSKLQTEYQFSEGLITHLGQPEGFVLLGSYLSATWMLRVMPDSYYNFEGGIQWGKVLLQLLITDAAQYGMHLVEHQFAKLYKQSHKPHHRFTNPRLFDAFNGSPTDTCLMILLPLSLTAQLVHCNLWSCIAFGSLYANWLTLIHSEVHHPWDDFFRKIGFGTPADHHVHHKYFNYNFGHLFLFWDRLGGTFKDPVTSDGFAFIKSDEKVQ